MSFELTMLAASCVLCLVQVIISSHAASLQRGYGWTASSRDAEVPPLTGAAGRLERALRNFLETFPIFMAAVLLVHVLGRDSIRVGEGDWPRPKEEGSEASGQEGFRRLRPSTMDSLVPLPRLRREVPRQILVLLQLIRE